MSIVMPAGITPDGRVVPWSSDEWLVVDRRLHWCAAHVEPHLVSDLARHCFTEVIHVDKRDCSDWSNQFLRVKRKCRRLLRGPCFRLGMIYPSAGILFNVPILSGCLRVVGWAKSAEMVPSPICLFHLTSHSFVRRLSAGCAGAAGRPHGSSAFLWRWKLSDLPLHLNSLS